MARELTALSAHRGKPDMIVSDNGTEFTCTPARNGDLVGKTTRSPGTSSKTHQNKSLERRFWLDQNRSCSNAAGIRFNQRQRLPKPNPDFTANIGGVAP